MFWNDILISFQPRIYNIFFIFLTKRNMTYWMLGR